MRLWITLYRVGTHVWSVCAQVAEEGCHCVPADAWKISPRTEAVSVEMHSRLSSGRQAAIQPSWPLSKQRASQHSNEKKHLYMQNHSTEMPAAITLGWKGGFEVIRNIYTVYLKKRHEFFGSDDSRPSDDGEWGERFWGNKWKQATCQLSFLSASHNCHQQSHYAATTRCLSIFRSFFFFFFQISQKYSWPYGEGERGLKYAVSGYVNRQRIFILINTF